jgi:hypothetical protein
MLRDFAALMLRSMKQTIAAKLLTPILLRQIRALIRKSQ